jgi:hypothetical protein
MGGNTTPWSRYYNLFVLNRLVTTRGARDRALAILYVGCNQNTLASIHDLAFILKRQGHNNKAIS